jgi:hypothetical protein
MGEAVARLFAARRRGLVICGRNKKRATRSPTA